MRWAGLWEPMSWRLLRCRPLCRRAEPAGVRCLSKIRVHELARELGITSKRVMEVLEVLGIPARSHSSTLSDQEAAGVREKLRTSRAGSGLITAPTGTGRAARRTPAAGRARLSDMAVRERPRAVEEAPHKAEPGRVTLRHVAEADMHVAEAAPLVAEPAEPPAPDAGPSEQVTTAPPHEEQLAEAPVVRTMPVTVTPVITIEQPPIETVVRPRARIEAPVVGAPADVAGPPPVDTTTRREAVRPREERREREEERRELRAARRDKGKPERGREVVTAGPARTRRGVEVGAVVKIPDPVSVRGLADALQLDTSDILRELLVRGAHSNINASISGEIARAIAADLGISVEIVAPDVPTVDTMVEAVEHRAKKRVKGAETDEVRERVPRPPVVTVLGHVDHGKTKLLDAIRKTNVVAGEAGGITQHIGASEVDHNGRTIVFLDTPGHEAFSAMRARGAHVTDIAILVVAADDGVMPQTIEAINHVKDAGVPIVVAVNKVDLPDANPDRVGQQLTELGLMPEDWGGSTVFVRVSALEGTGIEELLEMTLLVADVAELQADVGGPAKATVIEAKRDSSRGPVATVLVTEGILKTGDACVCGQHSGKVRALLSPAQKKLRKVEPGHACEVWGLEDVPDAGDNLQVVESSKLARQIAKEMRDTTRARMAASSSVSSLAGLMEQIQAGEVTDVNIVVKTDVHGSLEAITQALEALDHREVKVKVAHSGVGSVNESDINLAAAANAMIIAFHVGCEPGVESLAREERIELRPYSVIYQIIDDMKDLMTGKLRPVFEEVILGHAEVRALFKISHTGVVAGCAVMDGQMRRGEQIRVRRGHEVIYEGVLDSLRHVKDNVPVVEGGRECGISLSAWNSFQEGDVIECYMMKQLTRTLAD